MNLSIRDPILAKTLLDLSQTATINDSMKLGKAVLAQIGEVNSLHKSYVEQAGFAVLKAPDIPSILVETAFISNPEEEKRLKDDKYQEKIAGSIHNIDAQAIHTHNFSNLPYRQLVSWDGNYDDYYLVNLADGTRRKTLDKEHFGATLSPGGNYVLYFDEDDDNWYTVRVSDGLKTNITKGLGVKFQSETDDRPSIQLLTARRAGPKATGRCCSTIATTSGRSRPAAAALET